MKHCFLSLLSLFIFSSSFCQTYVDTKKEYSGKVPHNFSPDWQYLTMDLILLNEDKFSLLLNDLQKPKKNFFGKLTDSEDLIESLDLRVMLKDLKYFNNTEIEFPFFRLKVEYKNGSGKYSSVHVQQSEVQTILEDFPLGTVPSQVIDLQYKAMAVTREQQPQSLFFISQQLKNISMLSAPDKFVLSMVGQFGDYLNAQSEGKSVHWGTTLRAFENKNRHRRIHSINIYSMRPSDRLRDHGGSFPTAAIDSFLLELPQKEGLALSKSQLQQLTSFERYPFFVIVNYLTKYIPEDVPDNITHDEILSLQEQIRKDYEEGNDVKEVNRQRETFAHFLQYLADLQLAVEPFSDKYDGKFDYNQAHATFQVLIAYKKLLLAYERIVEQNGALPEFKGFYPRYEEVKAKAADELSLYPALKNVAQVVSLNLSLAQENPDLLSEDELELYISLLNGVELPEKFKRFDEYKSIERQLAGLENRLYEKRYRAKKDFFKDCEPKEENYKQYLSTQELLRKTKCRLCTEQVKEGLDRFKQRWDRKTFADALAQAKARQSSAIDLLTHYLTDTLLISSNKDSLLQQQPSLEIKLRHIQQTLFKEVKDLALLSQQAPLEQLSETELLNYTYKADKLVQNIEQSMENVNAHYPQFLAGCPHAAHRKPALPEKVVQQGEEKKGLEESTPH